MDSIESLRKMDDDELISLGNGQYGRDYRHGRIADEIEAEIAEKYMLLPVDADGVPIHPDDLMACTAFDTNDLDGKEHVMAVGNGFWVDKDGCTHIPSETLHVKPRTLESILCDALADVSCMGDGIVRTFKPDEPYVAELAAEIRELLGVSE